MKNIMTNKNYSLTAIEDLNNKSRITQNNGSIDDYIDNLFSRYSRLLVLRVDLDYKKDVDVRFMNTNEVYESYWQAKEDREHLFRNMRSNSLFDDMVGHIWKLEYGKKAGFHTHMVFFYDGSQVQQDVTIGRMIGEYWVNNITQGRGRAYNCNAKKEKYDRCGIGMINHYDIQLIKYLKEEAASYLAKPDEYISAFMKDMKIGRSFGRGIWKERTETRGRPRSRTQLYSETIL
jgi:hypothetical protein